MTAAIVSTLIGGLLALAGAFVGPFLQRKHDKWLARRTDHQTLRQKAEELFAELDVHTHISGKASLRIVERLQDETLDAISLPDLGRVRALSTVYFPQLLPHLDQFQTEISALGKELTTDLGAASKALDADKIRGIGVVMVLQHQQVSNKLARAVRLEIIEITPKFESDD